MCLSDCRLFRRETKFFINELPKYFDETECKLIIKPLKRYMDDGFIFWPLKLNFESFETYLNNIHLSEIKIRNNLWNQRKSTSFKFFRCKNKLTQRQFSWNWYLFQSNKYSELLSIRQSIPWSYQKEYLLQPSQKNYSFLYLILRKLLDELRQFLKDCKCPEHVISKRIFNAKLQSPAPNPDRSKNVIPFVRS